MLQTGTQKYSVAELDSCLNFTFIDPFKFGIRHFNFAQFDCNLTAMWFKFDVGGEETEEPEVPRLQ